MNYTQDYKEAEGESQTIGGINAVLAALKARPKHCRSIMMAEGRRFGPQIDEIYTLARKHSLSIKIVPRQALNRLYGSEQHQGLLAFFDPLAYQSFDVFFKNMAGINKALIVAMDQLEDPGNLGALMRSACAFGAKALLVSRERCAPLSQLAVKASAGAAENLPLLRVVNLRRALDNLKEDGFWVVGAEEGEAGDIHSFDFPEKTIIVLGSEGRGLSAMIKKTCDFLISIPQDSSWINSLNVSVAGGIMMSKYYSQHGG